MIGNYANMEAPLNDATFDGIDWLNMYLGVNLRCQLIKAGEGSRDFAASVGCGLVEYAYRQRAC